MQKSSGVPKLDHMIAHLRLLLADVRAREEQAAVLTRQLRQQSDRIVSSSLYGEVDLPRSLALLADIDERLSAADTERRHLGRIRQRAESELESLQLTKGVEQAKARLANLCSQRVQMEAARTAAAAPGAAHVDLARAQQLEQAVCALDDEIRRLQQTINEASERAARSLEGQRR